MALRRAPQVVLNDAMTTSGVGGLTQLAHRLPVFRGCRTNRLDALAPAHKETVSFDGSTVAKSVRGRNTNPMPSVFDDNALTVDHRRSTHDKRNITMTQF
ncbi:hypothetical protein EVAR_40781_1 [Eumeta japonica]|uniref:Uncharacterized protein n=1 Tax=Eumeta variegata TaxID=151549 RepID=A0A4C1X4L7_EUMVA|nr:hypothetical protein EVAR_40781_1 [Eumeta japonica]